MKNFILVTTVFISFVASAQITFTRNDYGRKGDKIIYAVDSPISSTINFGSTGANHWWRFVLSNTPKRYDSTTFDSVTSDPNAPGVSANLVLRTVANGDQYQFVNDTSVKMIVDMPAYRVSGIKLKLFNFPLTYQSSTFDSTNATTKGTLSEFGLPAFPGVDSVRIDAKINMSTVCDGWGTLTLPDSTSYNSLRVTNTIVINANIYVHSIIGWSFFSNRIQTNISYMWYAQDSKSYIASVGLDTFGNISSFTYKVQYAVKKFIPGKLISISPDSAQQGQNLMVTIKGLKTSFTQGIYNIWIVNYPVDSFKIIDDTTINAYVHFPISASLGWGYSEVDYLNGNWLTFNNGFKITASPLAPKLVSISPGFGNNGKTTDAVITGTRTHFTKGTNQINIYPAGSSSGNIYVNSFSIINDSTINCRILIDSNTKDTSCIVRVYNSTDGYLYLYNAFSVVLTGINDISVPQKDFSVYPNPAKDELNFIFNSISSETTIQISDLTGRVLKNISNTKKNLKVDVSDLCEGIYFCTIASKDFVSIKKILITK